MNGGTRMAKLGDFLRQQMEEIGGLRRLARRIDVSHTALTNIMENGAIPEPETMIKIGAAFKLPYWKVSEMAGVNLELPQTTETQAQRMASLVEKNPSLGKILERLATYDERDVEVILAHMEALESVRTRRHE